MRERRVHHLFVEELAAIVFRADGERARGARQQVALQPVGVSVERHDDRVVRGDELAAARGRQPAAARVLEHLRHDAAEEVHAAACLCNRRLGVDARRVLQVRARFREQTCRLPLAREQGVEACGQRRVVALEYVVNARAEQPRVEVRVALPHPHVFEFEQLRLRVRAHDEQVVTRFGREPPFGHARKNGERRAQPPHLARDCLGAARLQLRVVFVQARGRSARRVEGVIAAQVFVRELPHARIRGGVRGVRRAGRAHTAALRPDRPRGELQDDKQCADAGQQFAAHRQADAPRSQQTISKGSLRDPRNGREISTD